MIQKVRTIYSAYVGPWKTYNSYYTLCVCKVSKFTFVYLSTLNGIQIRLFWKILETRLKNEGGKLNQ